ncbi:MAG: hypothetical protein ABJN36_15310, partial [Cyclobacteriaceae bacterium]
LCFFFLLLLVFCAFSVAVVVAVSLSERFFVFVFVFVFFFFIVCARQEALEQAGKPSSDTSALYHALEGSVVLLQVTAAAVPLTLRYSTCVQYLYSWQVPGGQYAILYTMLRTYLMRCTYCSTWCVLVCKAFYRKVQFGTRNISALSVSAALLCCLSCLLRFYELDSVFIYFYSKKAKLLLLLFFFFNSSAVRTGIFFAKNQRFTRRDFQNTGTLLRMHPLAFREPFLGSFSVSPESGFDGWSILPGLRMCYYIMIFHHKSSEVRYFWPQF